MKNGLTISTDAEKRELPLRGALRNWPAIDAWRKPAPRYPRGVLAKYAHTVTSASLGAVTDADLKL